MFIVVVINAMYGNDYICAMLMIKPWNPNSKVSSVYLGYVRNSPKIKP